MTVRTQQSLGIRLAIFCWAGAIAFLLDQLTKCWVLSNIPAGSRRPFIPGMLDLFHVQNDGAAFSIGSGRPLFFAALTAVVVLGMIYAVMREKNLPLPLIAILGLVAGGGIGNGLERVAHGSVTDFLATTFMNFAIFNVADIFVTCGIIAACIYWFVWDSKRRSSENDGEASEKESGANKENDEDGEKDGEVARG
ncbi:signal peptidase II [Lancefieldella rimae]|uniref:signal peptidase II n=1 Tax=Lancefieldella rimae TaxID=1383 RepID=UPI00288BCD1B|nr:signal peptidase II [Lancefieldella rimae]